MDVEISPEPTEAEREAILRALEAEAETGAAPSPWQRGALDADEDQTTAPRRQSRGAIRA